MANEQREHIREIRNDFQASQRIKDSLNNSIQALAKDLYSKDTHFIFELIQNAEDNTYGELEPSLSFRLVKSDPTGTQGSDGALIIQNNEIGFSPDNVDAICAVGKTTKSKIQGYIGEKGIGFKSVFRVTTTPYIFSNGHHFSLPEHEEETGLGYIVPRWIEKTPEGIKPCQTTIILPLDKSGFGYGKIEEMLRDIEPETILFLSKLKEIEIKTDTGDALNILKDDSRVPRVQILVEGKIQGDTFSNLDEFLLYTKPFDKPEDINQEKRMGIDQRDVSIAFPLGEDKESVGKIFAYLPVRSDTGLPFLINADFILTSSREDIQRDVPWNRWLMDCVANLVANALPRLKEMGLLTAVFLEAVASRMTELTEASIFYPIVKAVRGALMDQELLPSDDGTFVSGRNAKLASADWLRKLLRERQLRELLKTEKPLKWIAGDITERGKHDLWKYIREELQVEEITPDSFTRKIDDSFLTSQPDEWAISFYNFLSPLKALWKRPSGYWDSPGPLRSKPFIRLQSGSHVRPFREDDSPNAYLTAGASTETALPIVKTEISKDEGVHQFLKELGIPELDIVAEVIEKILPKYASRSLNIPSDEHRRDVGKIEQAYSTDSQERKRRLKEKLRATSFVLSDNPCLPGAIYRKPTESYFRNDDLLTYFSGNDNIGFVSAKYGTQMLELLKELGASDNIRINCKSTPSSMPDVPLAYKHGYRRGLKGFDPDIEVDGLEQAFKILSIAKSNIIWNKIAVQYRPCIKGKILRSSRQDFSPNASTYKEEEIISNFGHLLINNSWLPGSNGIFYKPNELTLDDLPGSFIHDEKLADQLGMKKDIVAKLAEELGVAADDIELLKQHPEEFQKWKATIIAKKDKPEFPRRVSPNPERRGERLTEQLNIAPDKKYEVRDRSVRATAGTIDQALWLRNQYTNDAGQMICQICKEEMPFRKRDGEYYFEAVEAFPRDFFPKEHETQFLALCPLCAAMYKEFVKQDNGAMETLKHALTSSEEPEVSLQLGEVSTSLRFVESHYHDIMTILKAQE